MSWWSKKQGTDRLGRQATRIDLASDKYTCDECDRRLSTNEGYLLTTKQVVVSVESWRRVLLKWKREYPDLFKDHHFDLSFQRAASDTPWVICEGCSSMFTFDRKQAQDALEKYRRTGQFQEGQAVCAVSLPAGGGRTLVEPIDYETWHVMLNAITAASDQS